MPSRDSGRALLLVEHGSHHLRIESTEADQVNKENPSGHAIRLTYSNVCSVWRIPDDARLAADAKTLMHVAR